MPLPIVPLVHGAESAEPAAESVLPNLATGAPYARVPDERGRWLSLVVDDEPSDDIVAEAATPDAVTSTEPDVQAPMASPLEGAVGGLFDTPASIVALLQSANEHRRIVDLLWSAHQVGALRLPAALAERVERARASWPSALVGPMGLQPA